MSDSIAPMDRPRPPWPPLSSLIGREREVAVVTALLRRPDVRVVTLTGPGGVGKTRLTLQVAEELASAFSDGVAFVALAPVADPALVVPSIAYALSVSEIGNQPLVDALVRHLGDRELLLVLDNFEHLLAAGPRMADLAACCPQLKLLFTSRARLRITGEHIYPVPPLGVPPAGHLGLVDVAAAEAVRLFVARAEEVDPAFALTNANAAAVADICRRLDGLPLAIELAAARIDVLPPEAMLARLNRRLPLLTGGARDAPTRLQTMRAAIDWSYDLLSPEEQLLFRHLAIFAGGFTLEAAEAVAGDAFEDIASLCHKSLLHSVGSPGGTARYGMLETLREFGLEKLDAAGERVETRRRHTAYFLALSAPIDPIPNSIANATDERAWFDRLEHEEDNLWAILTWSLDDGEIESGLRLAAIMFLYWYFRKRRLGAARAWFERALPAGRDAGVPPDVLGYALEAASALAHVQNDTGRAVDLAEASLALWQQVDDPGHIAFAIYLQAIAVYMQGDCGRAEPLYRTALQGFRAIDDRPNTAETLLGLAHIAVDHGDYAQAIAHHEEALDLLHESGLSQTSMAAMARFGYGLLLRSRGDLTHADQLLCESLAIWGRLADPGSIAVCLEAIAGCVCGLGSPARAARLLGAAEALRERTDCPLMAGGVPTYRHTIAAVQSCLTMCQFATAWVEGRSLSTEEATALAFAELPVPAAPVTSLPGRRHTTAEGLTPREIEVMGLLAQGYSDQAIADALFISRRTASDHVGHILRKLDARSRAEVAAYAVKRGLG